MRRGCIIALLAVAWVSPGFVAPAGTLSLQGQPKAPQPPKGYKAFRDPGGRFSLDHPKDWLVIGGAGNVVVTLAHDKLEAVVVVERQTLAIAPSVITNTFLNIEVEDLKARQPDAQNVSPTMPANRQRVLIIDYSRTGIYGPERLRQYSFPEGTLLLRVTFIAHATKFDRYLATFSTIAGSVKIPAATTGGGALEFR